MLHILFLILKIIGILLLVVLGLILSVLAVVLFVPVRYPWTGTADYIWTMGWKKKRKN